MSTIVNPYQIDPSILDGLATQLEGDLFVDEKMRILYATDGSVYKEYPLAVAYPKNESDIQKLIHFSNQYKVALIPRAAGTSLGGQVVGNGIVVDISKHLNKVIEVSTEGSWVRVEPGVIRDELNYYLKDYKLYFAPETSTANRAMIAGMVGNNSCGANSIVYGSTRNHVLELKGFLSNGDAISIKALDDNEIDNKIQQKNREGEIYRFLFDNLSNPDTQAQIKENFPKESIHRRNTGYAVDVLLEQTPFEPTGRAFNLAELICGSEGTLMFITEIKLNLVPTPPKYKIVVAAHFQTLEESLKATVFAMKFAPSACELMDKVILDCTKANIEHRKNRFFVKGDPEAILCVEFSSDDTAYAQKMAEQFVLLLEKENLGYQYPLIEGNDINKVWSLRKAGLGLLANIPGDPKAVAVVEDTAVHIEDLPAYIMEFEQMMQKYGQKSVYYAHAGAGELHLRPILDLKLKKDRILFRQIGEETAHLVKKYDGSLSGEHGDGRVRGEFIPLMVGEANYQLLRDLKYTFDPENLLNPNKIVDTPPMDTSFRYEEDQKTNQFDTVLDFSEDQGILRAAERCNGCGECRKLPLSGGTMCPSYMATKNEKDTTRARANILRDFLTNSDKENKFDHQEIYDVMDNCLSCKGCTSECPSNVNIPALKAEFLHQYYKEHGVPLRTKAIANINSLNKLGSKFAKLSNYFMTNKFFSSQMKKRLGIAEKRSLPYIYAESLEQWFMKIKDKQKVKYRNGKVYLFIDEFTNFNDVPIGQKAVQLLNKLGYEVDYIKHKESGRAHLSKGLLDKAKELANYNVSIFTSWINNDTPLIGIEPSTILTFRDEYLRLVEEPLKDKAKNLAKNCFMIEEFIYQEMEKGNITNKSFTKEPKVIKLQGHCHQKSLSSADYSAWIMGLPENYVVDVIPSGCCGMAGSFGYEKEHYDLSMQIGELVMFPAIRAAEKAIIASSGTSCRHQIKDGTARIALHPIEVLFDALV
ncbi:MAG TPA: FAD-linked oxidase C-terminal domain-containing protein [Chitinophagales bacterium]|nr:FAD-binding protein [Chitinophagales bacterium]HMU98602.1 FAD-linked oxidase C-terminal domain-containing protein [Chitinophagales bacterium]HMV03058.1 FAD-linked oxidase C-terminal domain-containing protein [Chitinophagales bacterium]HMW94901.1 FAD-linked oxidase C-terminal domain-containing protein [Chitinophagales bacterium]HMY42842.1 FAD-linked oxidase C-terminal domain-containing protein [Chitinophagales bacterium]